MAIPFKSTISVSQIENVSLINSKNGGLLLRGGHSNLGGNYLDLGSTSLVALYSSQQSTICIGDSYPSSSSDN